MKTFKITTDDMIKVVDIDLHDFAAIEKELAAKDAELVKTQFMYDYFGFPIGMFVDGNGGVREDRAPLNHFATRVYNGVISAPIKDLYPIYGDVILCVPTDVYYKDYKPMPNLGKWAGRLADNFNLRRETWEDK